MPRLEYFLVSESYAVDRSTGAVSIFHVLNEVEFAEFPATIDRLSLVSCWVASEEEVAARAECQVRFQFELPGDVETGIFRANLTIDSKYQRLHYAFFEVPVAHPGDLVVTVYLDDAHQATHTITLTRAT